MKYNKCLTKEEKQTELYHDQDNMPWIEHIHIYTRNHNITCRGRENEILMSRKIVSCSSICIAVLNIFFFKKINDLLRIIFC